MNGQYLCNRQLNVSYAYKKDGTKSERHGSAEGALLLDELVFWRSSHLVPASVLPAERKLASQATTRNLRPKAEPMMFGSTLPPRAAPVATGMGMPAGMPPMGYSPAAAAPPGTMASCPV